ncbi:Kunitz/Bovine pancreatic trypsin inhibitor domain protein [Trichuris suis]|nr:Kunitz/Bovine pancreatic trypsin inhibitor domain protein [Trichuris suis]
MGGQRVTCTPERPNCPPAYWCHFGYDEKTTACCPGAEQLNPCSQGFPASDESGAVYHCGEYSISCPTGYWCHYGASRATTVCCPGASSSPCKLPMSFGSGNAQLQRFYFDVSSQKCLMFIYGGIKGNQNNFPSKEACEETCTGSVNPCPQGEPAISGFSGERLLCSPEQPDCPQGYWCHKGGMPRNSVCCPGAVSDPCILPIEPGFGSENLLRFGYNGFSKQCRSFYFKGLKGNQNNFMTMQQCVAACQGVDNPCQLPLAIGSGSHNLNRWYFNGQTNACVAFFYGGTRGNQNNFLTQEECNQACIVEVSNPCPEGKPLTGPDGNAQTCNALSATSSCPSGYWCHVGATIGTTVCCQGSRDPCTLPMATGVGEDLLPRWYYEPNTERCVQFTYRGSKGNQNNFLSMEACRAACREFRNPCIGQPARTTVGQVVYCSATNKENCPVNFWCHIGDTAETTMCCPGGM